MKNIISKYQKIIFFSAIVLIAVIFFIFLSFSGNKNNDQPNNQELPTTIPSPSGSPNPLFSLPVPISPLAGISSLENGKIYGINRKNGNLVKFEDNKESVIYSGKVSGYDIKENIALILDDSNPSDIIVIDLKTRNQKRITLTNLSPIVSVTLSADLKTIYFLAEFNIANKNPSINSVDINGLNQKKLGETTAQSINYLKDNVLLLFEDTHAQDKSILYFYDIKQNKVLFSKSANTFLLSPDAKHLLIKTSTNIEVVDTDSFQSRSKQTIISNRYTWKDNNTAVIFRNDGGNVYYSVLTINPFEISQFQLFVKDAAMQTVFGFIENKLIWQDYKENILGTIVTE